MINEICQFQREILSVHKNEIGELTASEAKFIATALSEEYGEWVDALKSGNIVDQVDALLDLSYFAIGAIYKLGLTSQQIQACFDHIHDTNMTKKVGTKVGREGFGENKDAVLDSVKHDDLSKLLQTIIEDRNDEYKETK